METPRPTHTRSAPAARVRSTTSRTCAPTEARAPVTPIDEAAYTHPLECAAMRASLRAGEDGADRYTRSRPLASAAASHCAPSSGGRSGVIRPEPPTPAKSAAKRSTPHHSTGFQ